MYDSDDINRLSPDIVRLIDEFEKSINKKVVSEYRSYGKDARKVWVRLFASENAVDIRNGLMIWLRFQLEGAKVIPSEKDELGFMLVREHLVANRDLVEQMC